MVKQGPRCCVDPPEHGLSSGTQVFSSLNSVKPVLHKNPGGLT